MKFQDLRDLIVETLNCDADCVTPDARLKEDLGADSLSAVELCMALEEACSIQIADDALPGFHTVGDIIRYLEQNGSQQ